jgi:hypothetical protein
MTASVAASPVDDGGSVSSPAVSTHRVECKGLHDRSSNAGGLELPDGVDVGWNRAAAAEAKIPASGVD